MLLRKLFPRALALSAAVLATAARVEAQAPVQCTPLAVAADSATAAVRPDIVISASVQASELRFQSAPRASVRLGGCAALDSARVVERRNLPKPVQPGAVYRDVYVAVEIVGHLNASCLAAAVAGTASDRPEDARLCAATDTAATGQRPRR